jgi:hypothetical protein
VPSRCFALPPQKNTAHKKPGKRRVECERIEALAFFLFWFLFFAGLIPARSRPDPGFLPAVW